MPPPAPAPAPAPIICAHDGCPIKASKGYVHCRRHRKEPCSEQGCEKLARNKFCSTHTKKKVCKFEDCSTNAAAGGFCGKHVTTPCDTTNCVRKAIVGRKFCTTHAPRRKCIHPGEGGQPTPCTLTALAGHFFCSQHTKYLLCKVTGCSSRTGDPQQLCKKHSGKPQRKAAMEAAREAAPPLGAVGAVSAARVVDAPAAAAAAAAPAPAVPPPPKTAPPKPECDYVGKAGCHRNGYSGMQGFCTVHFKLDHLTSLLADLQQKGVLKETLSKQVDATLDDGARKEAWGKIAEAKMQSNSAEDRYTLGSAVINFFRPGTDTSRLPTSSTCFNLLKLPIYKSRRALKEKLLYSINSGAGFELS
eukprot:gene348-15252_t